MKTFPTNPGTNLIDHEGKFLICVLKRLELSHQCILRFVSAKLYSNTLCTISQAHLRQRDVTFFLRQLLLQVCNISGQIVDLKERKSCLK